MKVGAGGQFGDGDGGGGGGNGGGAGELAGGAGGDGGGKQRGPQLRVQREGSRTVSV